MSEGKRVSLQSIGPTKKDKKSKSTPLTIRLNLSLPASSSDTFADFNYNSLILNEKRKKEKSRDKEEKVNGVSTLDPYASDDDDNLRQIARSFESKYGTPKTKKKCRRLEDYEELGTGYDENDSFIDNSDAYNEVVPEDKTPELNGFYINKGHLVLKSLDGHSSNQSDSDEGPQTSKGLKRRLSSDEESSSSESSSDSDESEGSDDSDDEEDENEEAEVDTEESPNKVKDTIKEVKEEKSNGHVISPPAKKPKVIDDHSKKANKNRAIAGVFLKKAVSEKEHNEKHHKDSKEEGRRISNVDAAIEAVARGDDSKESGIAESKSRSGSSDESDSEEVQKSLKVNGDNLLAQEALRKPIPEGLPDNILSVISSLKTKAIENSSLGKQQFFTSDVNALLLRFEKFMRCIPREKKGAIYDHLELYLPCRKETIMKRGKALLIENVEAGFREPLEKLKAGIAVLMPNAMERYRAVCIKYENNVQSSHNSSDPSQTSPEKAKIPRRRFPWTEELRNLLCLAVRKRRIYYGTVKRKDDVWYDHLQSFLKREVVPMWEVGWMKISSLLDVIQKIAPDLLVFKPLSPENKVKGNSQYSVPKKQVVKSEQTIGHQSSSPMETASHDGPKSNPLPKPTNLSSDRKTVVSKPLQHGSHQSQNNASVACSESDVKKNQFPHHSASDGASSNSVQPHLAPMADSSALDIKVNEMVESIRTSLANSLVSVTPVQNSSYHPAQTNPGENLSVDIASKMRNITSNSAATKRPRSRNGVDIINLQSNGMDSTSIEAVPKKKQQFSSNPKPNTSSKQTYNFNSSDISISQASGSNFTTSQGAHSVSAPNPIKVSSVSAINLKLSGSQPHQTPSHSAQISQVQVPLNKPSLLQQLKGSSHQNVQSSSSSQQKSLNSQSVIAHGLDTSSLGVNSSVTITPVKPSLNNNSYYQQAKMAGHQLNASTAYSSQLSNSASTGALGTSNVRSEVIVTPSTSSSSSMPHIKSTSANLSVNSVNNVPSSNSYSSSHISSSNNFPASHSANITSLISSRSGLNSNYSSSHGHSGNSYSNNQSSSDSANMRTHQSTINHSENQVKNLSSAKSAYPQSSRSSDKSSYMSQSMWSSSVPVEAPRSSSSSSPSSVKSVTPSPEKALVSRKDRILQDSRERGGVEPVMPTLSGPYRSNTSMDQSNVRSQQAKPSSQSLPWDDELIIIEDFLKMTPSSSIPQNTHKVSSASMDTYKHSIPVLEPQRYENVPSKSPFDPLRSKNTTTITTSESSRVNVVMHTPVHNVPKTNPLSFTQHPYDQPRTNSLLSNHVIRDMPRLSSSKSSSSSSSNLDPQRVNVVMATPHFQESQRVNSLKDEMSDILEGIPTQMISGTDHYTITNSMSGHNPKRKGFQEISDVELDLAIGPASATTCGPSVRSDPKFARPDDSMKKAQELTNRGILMSRTNGDSSFMEDSWGAAGKKTVSSKSSNDISDERLSGMSGLSSSLSMTGLDGMGLGLPSHMVGYQNDYQRHLYGSSSKGTGPNDHRPS